MQQRSTEKSATNLIEPNWRTDRFDHKGVIVSATRICISIVLRHIVFNSLAICLYGYQNDVQSGITTIQRILFCRLTVSSLAIVA